MIEFICLSIVVLVIINLTNSKFKIPFEKTYTFNIHKSEINVYEKGDKVNPWLKPDSNEILFYATNFNNSSKRIIGSIHNKNIYNYITETNKKTTKAHIYYSDNNIVQVKLILLEKK